MTRPAEWRHEGWWLPSILLLASICAAEERPAAPTLQPSPGPLEHCSSAIKEVYGETPTGLDRNAEPPKPLRQPSPKYPQRQSGTCSGGAEYELLIGPTGRVERLWAVREPKCEPPWPALGEAMRTAIKKWRYEPATIAGKAVATCGVTTVNIRWQ